MPERPYANAPRLPEPEVLDPRELFAAANAELELEIGPGRGWFMVERLSVNPNACLLGLEIRRKWATIVNQRLIDRGFGDRGRVFAEDATRTLPRFVPGCISIAYVHFPDPWWKKRHHKRLVLSAPFLNELGRVIRPGGELFVQTDVEERAQVYESLISGHPAFEAFGPSARVEDSPYGARSPRERRAIEDGLPVFRLRFRRITTETRQAVDPPA